MARTLRDDELKKKLTPQQYHILREKDTERPSSGKYLSHNQKGMYTCAACGAELFSSDSKYESNQPGLTGWPSFAEAAKSSAVRLEDDHSLGMHRIEVICANCGSHLGHVFDDDDSRTGKHYCINSTALDFKPGK